MQQEKTTLAMSYCGYKHLPTDGLCSSWRVKNMLNIFNVGWTSNLIRGNYRREYIDYLIDLLRNWLESCVNCDLVIEGYDLMFDDFQERVSRLLNELGWQIIKEIELTKKYDKEY